MTWELMWKSMEKPNMDNSFLMGTWNGLGCWEPGALITVRDTGKLNMLAVINGEYKALPNLCNKNVLDGEWHHIVATFSKSNKTMRLFVDGCMESELQRVWNPRFQAFDMGYEPGTRALGESSSLDQHTEDTRDMTTSMTHVTGAWCFGTAPWIPTRSPCSTPPPAAPRAWRRSTASTGTSLMPFTISRCGSTSRARS
eukprot:Skav221767  [mRNA]  locus=scaffold490:359264:364834:- [translate_table: standard]